MTVSLGLKHRGTGEYRVVPIACSEPFREQWIPAARALGLELVPHFHDGTFTLLPIEQIPHILDELRRLREYAMTRQELIWIVERADNVVETLQITDPIEWEYDIG